MTAALMHIPLLAQAAPAAEPASGNTLVQTLVIIAAVFAVLLGIVIYLVLLERKVAAWVQDRVGPNRCGPLGLIQPLADAVKMFFKEEFTPARADRWLFIIAPIWIMIPALMGVAVVPLGGQIEVAGQLVDLQIASIDVAALYVLAVASLGTYGVVLGGWASNSKYSFLGGLRATAQMLSYEIPLGLTVMTVILISGGTLRLEAIVEHQAHLWMGWLPAWNVFTQPLAFLIFVICLLAESNRLPFDLPEAEQELVGGYHTEYSSMKFGLFMMAEYSHILVASCIASVLFLGGWHFWGLRADQTQWYFGLLRIAVLLGKAFVLVFLIMQIRWTLPRFRFDQLMRLAWKGLVPATLLLLTINGVLLHLGLAAWTFTLGNLGVFMLLLIAAGFTKAPITGRQRLLQHVEMEKA